METTNEKFTSISHSRFSALRPHLSQRSRTLCSIVSPTRERDETGVTREIIPFLPFNLSSRRKAIRIFVIIFFLFF